MLFKLNKKKKKEWQLSYFLGMVYPHTQHVDVLAKKELLNVTDLVRMLEQEKLQFIG